MIFISGSSMGPASFGGLGEQGHRACAADGTGQLPLMPGAAPRDATRGDLATLRDEVAKPANILVVDEADAIDAELANLAATEPAPLDGLSTWRNGLFLLLERNCLERDWLERHLVVGVPTPLHRPRHPPPRGRGGGLAASHELHPLRDDLDDAALLTVLRFPVASLQPPLDHDRATLVEVLATALGLLAPHHHREETGLFAFLSALRRVVPVDGQPEVGHRGAARRV